MNISNFSQLGINSAFNKVEYNTKLETTTTSSEETTADDDIFIRSSEEQQSTTYSKPAGHRPPPPPPPPAEDSTSFEETEASLEESFNSALMASTSSDEAETETATKGLSSDQISALKQQTEEQMQQTLEKMAQALVSNQSSVSGILSGILGGSSSDYSAFDLPPLATTPEEAAAAIADGGPYSVEAVGDRIFEMAEILSGGDPDKMEEMREAVIQAFKEVGMDLETGDGMPDITFDTYNYIMDKFDNYGTTA